MCGKSIRQDERRWLSVCWAAATSAEEELSPHNGDVDIIRTRLMVDTSDLPGEISAIFLGLGGLLADLRIGTR